MRDARLAQHGAVRGRFFALQILDAEGFRDLGADQRLAGQRHPLRAAMQGADDAAGEFRRFGVLHDLLVLVRPLLDGVRRSLGFERSQPKRDGGDVMVFQIHAHVSGKFINPGFLRAIGGTMHIAHGTEGRGESDQAAAGLYQQRCRIKAGDVGRPQADIEDVNKLQRTLPETARRDQLIVNGGGVVDQNIQPALVLRNALEQLFDLSIPRVVDRDGDAAAAMVPLNGASPSFKVRPVT
jgi:hypothetical protein